MLSYRKSILMMNAELAASAKLLDGGWLDIYSGTQPATPEDRPGADAFLLASLQFASPAFGSPVDGVIKARGLKPDSAAARTGTPTWFRMTKADHRTAVVDGSVGMADADLIINAEFIQRNAEVAIGTVILKA